MMSSGRNCSAEASGEGAEYKRAGIPNRKDTMKIENVIFNFHGEMRI